MLRFAMLRFAMLRFAALLLLAAPIATAQAPAALVDLAARPLIGPSDDPFCLAQPGQTPGVVHVTFKRRIPVGEARALVAAVPGTTVRAPRPELSTVYFLNVEVPAGFEAVWCERLSAQPGLLASRLGPTVWARSTVSIGHGPPNPWPGSIDGSDVARVRERLEAAWR